MERRMKSAALIAVLPLLLLAAGLCHRMPGPGPDRHHPAAPVRYPTLHPRWGLPGATVRSFAVSGTTAYAGCIGGGVYRSTNNGLTWSAVGAFLPHDVRALATDGTYLYAGIGDGTSSPNDGVYRIKLSGGSWESFGLTETVWALPGKRRIPLCRDR